MLCSSRQHTSVFFRVDSVRGLCLILERSVSLTGRFQIFLFVIHKVVPGCLIGRVRRRNSIEEVVLFDEAVAQVEPLTRAESAPILARPELIELIFEMVGIGVEVKLL